MSRSRKQLIRDSRAAGFDVVEEFGGLVDIRLRDVKTNQLISGVRLYRNGAAYSHVSAHRMHSYSELDFIHFKAGSLNFASIRWLP